MLLMDSLVKHFDRRFYSGRGGLSVVGGKLNGEVRSPVTFSAGSYRQKPIQQERVRRSWALGARFQSWRWIVVIVLSKSCRVRPTAITAADRAGRVGSGREAGRRGIEGKFQNRFVVRAG